MATDGPEQREAERQAQFEAAEFRDAIREREADDWFRAEMERDMRQALAFGKALDAIFACFERPCRPSDFDEHGNWREPIDFDARRTRDES